MRTIASRRRPRLLLPVVAVLIVAGLIVIVAATSAADGKPGRSLPAFYTRTATVGPVVLQGDTGLSLSAHCDTGDQLVSGGYHATADNNGVPKPFTIQEDRGDLATGS